MSFRDSSIVVIETDSKVVRAGRGLADPLSPPTIEIPARVGLRRKARLPNFDLLDVKKTSANGSGSGTPINGAHRDRHATPHNGMVKLKASSYLVGDFLTQAEAAGEELDIFWPFQEDDVKDWIQAEAIWKYILFHGLRLRRDQNEFPVLLCLPISLPRSTHESITQIFFERFNVAAFSIFEKPILQLFATGSTSGVVVNICEEKTDIAVVVEAMILYPSTLPFAAGPHAVPLGVKDCELYLASILQSNSNLIAKLSPPTSPLEPSVLNSVLQKVVRKALNDGLIKVPTDGLPVPPDTEEEGVTNIAAVLVAGKERAVIEAGTKKKQAANEKKGAAEREREREIAALDLVELEVSFCPNPDGTGEEQTVKVTLGKERHRFCEPLFNPTLLCNVPGIPEEKLLEKVLALHEAIRLIVGTAEFDQRPAVWDSVYLTGDLLPVKNLGLALQARLTPYVITDPELGPESLTQARGVRMVKVPDYFSRFRDDEDRLSAFLGACIVAKLTFNDPTGRFVSKTDYSTKGPGAIADVVF